MQIITNIELISINETAILQLISFLLFLFLINRVMIRPLRNTMDERDRCMDQMKQDTLEAEEKLRDYTRQIEKRRDKVKFEAWEVFRELEEEGRTQAHAIADSTSKEINELREKTEKELSARIFKARKSLLAEAEPLTVCMMEKLLERRLS